ncbi:hypothetical protein PAPYR_12836 [Paratrimastix pyriformis]|uniref:Uncharacterized protein n=1 Tax=Paratrimastix pyriformis TaxID=342808 RepID=A0ABQ8U3P7_9EUKA|nr:hypothetical protein PAPYR_12836 [Paratrimastix pyriformis]
MVDFGTDENPLRDDRHFIRISFIHTHIQGIPSPLDIWIGTLFFECAIFITPPTRARGPPTLVAHHPVHTVQGFLWTL